MRASSAFHLHQRSKCTFEDALRLDLSRKVIDDFKLVECGGEE